jgi:1,4-dihydroxy-2-naphthoate octaprenyltransferase
VEALKNYFSEYYDYQVAKDRFEDASDEIITSQEMRKHLGL